MEAKQIIESGFVKAFIAEYFEYKIHSFYPDKDRLLYVLCSTEIERQQVTDKQIEIIKSEIQKIGHEELSFAYLLSGKSKKISGHEYIEPDKRFDYWLNRFNKEFIDSINTFNPIFEACELFKDKLPKEDFENQFWDMFPASQKPKETCLPFVIQREAELITEIENTISDYKENEYWVIDFEEYKRYIDISKPIELLFSISELLVQLNRLEMFNEILLQPQITETKTDKLKVPQIALIHVYEGIQITRQNAAGIAAEHGYTAKNSGEGLFQDYTFYCSTANRKGKPTPCTPRKLKNKIELLESVVNHLSDKNKLRANEEIGILKILYEKEYQ